MTRTRTHTEHAILHDGRRGRLGSALAFAAAVAVFFLIGFYAIGPWIQGSNGRTRPSTPTTAPEAQPEASREAPEPPRVSSVRVQITERTRRTASEAPPPRPEPTPAQPQPQPSPPSTRPPQPVNAATAPAPLPAPQRLYKVKAGTFDDPANAEALAQKLRDAGFSPSIVRINVGGVERSTVQVGAFADRARADALGSTLRDAGFDATITPSE